MGKEVFIFQESSAMSLKQLWDASWWFSASHQAPYNYVAYVRHKVFFVLCILGHRTCSQLWSKGQPARPTRTDSSCLTSSCQTSTQLCRLCSGIFRSAAAASIPTCTTMARCASACWAPGLARWVLQNIQGCSWTSVNIHLSIWSRNQISLRIMLWYLRQHK